MDDLLDALARLTARLESLERRLSALEQVSSPSVTNALPPASPTVESSTGAFSLTQAPGMLPVAGKAMLGIAGAYLLRAVAESGSVPKLIVVALALSYASLWLIWAARVAPGSGFAGAAYSGTAVLILVPMLWELTLSFRVLSPWDTSAVLCGVTVLVAVLAWKHNLALLVWVTNLTAVAMVLALMIATRDLMPFVAALLWMACVAEFAACRNRWSSLRPLVAIVADLATLVAIYVLTSPESVRSEYVAVRSSLLIALASILFLIYGLSTVVRTLLLGRRITVFEIGQTSAAFCLAAFGVLSSSQASETPLGVACLVFSCLCCAATFGARFTATRNYHVYGTWSAALFVAGCVLCLSPLATALCLSVAAVAATFLGFRFARLTLEFHGLVYLSVAYLASGLLTYAGRVLAGSFPAVPGWIDWIVAGAAILCYAILGRYQGEPWNQRLPQLLSAILAVSAAATFLVSILVWLTALGIAPGLSHVAVIRTLTICILALALAFKGSRWQRIELVWIAYGMLGLVTAKLLFEDLHHSQSGFVAISLCLYAGALILMPRVVRSPSKAPEFSLPEQTARRSESSLVKCRPSAQTRSSGR